MRGQPGASASNGAPRTRDRGSWHVSCVENTSSFARSLPQSVSSPTLRAATGADSNHSNNLRRCFAVARSHSTIFSSGENSLNNRRRTVCVDAAGGRRCFLRSLNLPRFRGRRRSARARAAWSRCKGSLSSSGCRPAHNKPFRCCCSRA